MNRRISGIIEFGSVPSPPRKPKSSTRTQSARQNTAPATTAIRASRALARTAAAVSPAPISTSAMTATRLTANPCAAVRLPNQVTSTASGCGCDVPAMDWTMAASDPGLPSIVPCQKPRPGQA